MDKAAVAKDLSELIQLKEFIYDREIDSLELVTVEKSSDLQKDFLGTDVKTYLWVHRKILELDKRTTSFLKLVRDYGVGAADSLEPCLDFMVAAGKCEKPSKKMLANYNAIVLGEYKKINNIISGIPSLMEKAGMDEVTTIHKLITDLELTDILGSKGMPGMSWGRDGSVTMRGEHSGSYFETVLRLSPKGDLGYHFNVHVFHPKLFDLGARTDILLDVIAEACGQEWVTYSGVDDRIRCQTEDITLARKLYEITTSKIDALMATPSFSSAEELCALGHARSELDAQGIEFVKKYGGTDSAVSLKKQHNEKYKEYKRLVGCLAEQLI